MVRKISWKTYLTAAVVTGVIFIVGINFGYLISGEKIEILRNDLENLIIQSQDTETGFTLLNSYGTQSCNSIRYELNKTTYLASKLGDRLIAFDIAETFKEAEYYNLRDQYMLTLVRFWLFWNLFKENCENSVNTILYFYSIGDCSDCTPQGLVLSTLKREYPEDIMIFSLDFNSDLYSINLLKNSFNITTTPTLIINRDKYEGFRDYNALKQILKL